MENLQRVSFAQPLSKYIVTQSLIALVFAFSAVLFAKFFWKRRYLYFTSWKMKGPFAWPILGNILQFSGNTEVVLNNIVNMAYEHPEGYRVWLGPDLYICITTPEDAEIIFNNPNTLQKSPTYAYMVPLTGGGLLTAPVSVWKPHRKMIYPMFNQKVLNSFIPVFEDNARRIVEVLKPWAENKSTADPYQIIITFTLSIISETAMNFKVDTTQQENAIVNAFTRAAEILCMRLYKAYLYPSIIFNIFYRNELEKHTKIVKDTARTIIQEKKEEFKENKLLLANSYEPVLDKRKSILEMMIEISENGNKLTDEEMLHEVITLLVTGTDTTASVTGFVLMMLGMHPEIQQKVFEELDGIFCGNDRPISYEDLNNMKYLDRVIDETLRLFPVAPVVLRSATEDTQLTNCTLPKGSVTAVVIQAIHRNPKYWKDPLIFDPDRHLPETLEKQHPCTFIPFTAGPRKCIGYKYALMELKVVLSQILLHYKVGTCYKSVSDLRLKMDIVSKPVEGYKVTFEHREV